MPRLPLLLLVLAVPSWPLTCNLFFRDRDVGTQHCKGNACASSVATFPGNRWVLGGCDDDNMCMDGTLNVPADKFNQLIALSRQKLPEEVQSVSVENECCTTNNCNKPRRNGGPSGPSLTTPKRGYATYPKGQYYVTAGGYSSLVAVVLAFGALFGL